MKPAMDIEQPKQRFIEQSAETPRFISQHLGELGTEIFHLYGHLN